MNAGDNTMNTMMTNFLSGFPQFVHQYMNTRQTSADPLQAALDINALMMHTQNPVDQNQLFAMPTSTGANAMGDGADINNLLEDSLWNQEDEASLLDLQLNKMPAQPTGPSFMQMLMADPVPIASAFQEPIWSETCLFNTPEFLPLGSTMLAEVEEAPGDVKEEEVKATLPPLPPIGALSMSKISALSDAGCGTPGAVHTIDKRMRKEINFGRQRAGTLVLGTFEKSKG
jgi:hypothetical protein